VRIPENAANGDVQIEIFFPDWDDVEIASQHFTIPLKGEISK
jgi:hypothetical protein